jgi:uncharacterized protein (DUF2267 family)
MDQTEFLNQVEKRSGLTRDQAYKVMLAALQELHDRLSPKEADDLGAQLAGEIKAMWFGLNAPGREVRRTHKKDFVRHIAEAAEISEVDAGRALMAVFKTLQMALASPTGREGEAWDVFSQLPKDLKQVWMAAAGMGAAQVRKPAS